MANPPPADRRAFARPARSPDFVKLGTCDTDGAREARAHLLGARIETREIAGDQQLANVAKQHGLTFAFRFGVVVSIGPAPRAEAPLQSTAYEWLAAHVIDPTAVEETESANLVISAGGGDRISPDGQIQLADFSDERLLLTATVLAHSVILSRDEILVSEAFDHIAALVTDLRENGRVRLSIGPVMRQVGEVIAARHRVMGTVGVDERPDILWDQPQLDRLYTRLEAEYELTERAAVLERKFVALGDFTEVLLDIVQDKRAFRLEVAIIVLIAFEIVLNLVMVLR